MDWAAEQYSKAAHIPKKVPFAPADQDRALGKNPCLIHHKLVPQVWGMTQHPQSVVWLVLGMGRTMFGEAVCLWLSDGSVWLWGTSSFRHLRGTLVEHERHPQDLVSDPGPGQRMLGHSWARLPSEGVWACRKIHSPQSPTDAPQGIQGRKVSKCTFPKELPDLSMAPPWPQAVALPSHRCLLSVPRCLFLSAPTIPPGFGNCSHVQHHPPWPSPRSEQEFQRDFARLP